MAQPEKLPWGTEIHKVKAWLLLFVFPLCSLWFKMFLFDPGFAGLGIMRVKTFYGSGEIVSVS